MDSEWVSSHTPIQRRSPLSEYISPHDRPPDIAH